MQMKTLGAVLIAHAEQISPEEVNTCDGAQHLLSRNGLFLMKCCFMGKMEIAAVLGETHTQHCLELNDSEGPLSFQVMVNSVQFSLFK